MRRRWIIAALLLALTGLAGHTAAQKGDSKLRAVKGQVLDKDENPLADGIVFLKNLKTNTVRTHISDAQGGYRFTGLDPNVDYQIHAEYKDNISSTRSISSFDTRKEIVIHLKVDKKKKSSS